MGCNLESTWKPLSRESSDEKEGTVATDYIPCIDCGERFNDLEAAVEHFCRTNVNGDGAGPSNTRERSSSGSSDS